MSDTYGGKLRTFGHKKAGTSNFSNPSLVSPTTPTLANPVRDFGLPTNNIIQTATEESTNLQETQSADEQSLLSQAIQQQSFGHDIRRMALRRPQAKLTVGEPDDKYEQEADRVANQVMRMASPATPNFQRQVTKEEVEEIQTKPLVQQTGMVQHKLDDESQTQKFGQPVTTPKTDQFGIEPDGANSAEAKNHSTGGAGSEAIPPVDTKQEALSTQPSLPAPTQANSEAAYPSNSIPEKSGNAVLDKSATAELASVPQPGGIANEVVSPQTNAPQTEVAESQQSLPNPAGQLPQLDKAIDPSAMAIAEAEQPQELPEIPQPTIPESPELAQAAQQIIQTKEIEKAALTQTIEAQQNFLQQQTEIQVEAIQAATQGKIQGITSDIAAKKAEVQQTFSTTKANLKGQIENHKTNIQAETTRGLNSLQQEVENKRKGANTTAENEAKQVEQTGQTEATRATTSTAESATAVNAIAKQQGDRYGSKPEEKTAARQGTGQASAQVVGKLTSRGQSLAKDAREAAQKAAQEFRAAGQKLAAGVGSNTAQVEKAIRDNANTITSQFISQITQQLQKIDTLQTKALASLENLKSSSISGIKQAGNSAAAAAKISGKTAATQVSQFKVASLNQLDKGAHQVVEKLNQVPNNKKINKKAVDKFIQETKEPFQQTRLQLETALSSQVSGAHNSLNQLGSAVSGHLDGLQQKVTGEADKATNSLSTGLAQVPEQAAQQVQQSVTSNKNANEQLISQFGGGIQQKIDEANQGWVQQQQKVNNDIRSKVDEGIKSNKDVESKAPSDFAQVAQSAAEKAADPGWLQVLKGIGEGILKVLVGLAIFVAVVALVIFLLPEEIVAAIGIAGVAAIVGLGFLIYGFINAMIKRSDDFWKTYGTDIPWYEKVLGFFGVFAAALGDAVGITAIIEGIVGKEAFTGKEFTPEERAEKITEGVLTLALMFIMGRVLKGLGKPGELKSPIPDPIKDPVDPSKGKDPIDPTNPPKYNPKTRTDAELQLDKDPTPRPGETPQEATERARMAEEEHVQRVMDRYNGLGEEPNHVDMAANDAAHADAHTGQRHGSNIPEERTLDANGQPDGTRTIEGRIYGDPPWNQPGEGGRQNFSAKWLTQDILNQTINRYLRNNWEQIRSDLAIEGEHSNSFDAGKIVGKGYFNRNFGQPGGPVAQGPTVTPMVFIAIKFVPGNPPSFYVITTYPTLRGF
ncbi:hypothetical protein [Nostoc sp.]|uniref:hypothetical protein n=1 Tax=Nostoc sp. TaxID=1180 RepID=UPI002FF5E9BE